MKNIFTVASLSLVGLASALVIPSNFVSLQQLKREVQISARDNTCPKYGNLPDLVSDTASVFTTPQGMTAKIVAHGLGFQNYTCGDDKKYASAGAVATLYDMCGGQGTGHHYFQPSPTDSTAISPVFDFRTGQDQDDTTQYVYVKLDSTIAPDNDPYKQDVPWLKLDALDLSKYGSLAKVVFRVNTIGGAAPASCDTPGSDYSVPYQADYWFFA